MIFNIVAIGGINFYALIPLNSSTHFSIDQFTSSFVGNLFLPCPLSGKLRSDIILGFPLAGYSIKPMPLQAQNNKMP